MQTRSVVVVRGSVDVPAADPAAIAEQRRINLLSSGFGARTHAYTRRFYPGEMIVGLPAADAHRLARLGVVTLVGLA
jgi:hypothetical protein